MKKNVFLLFALSVLISAPAFSQVSFGVAPGLNLNTAYVGYKFGKVVPFVSFNMAGLSYNRLETGYEWNGSAVEAYEDEIDLKGSLILPSIGVKYFAIEKNNIKGYALLSLTKPLLNATEKENGVEDEDLETIMDYFSFLGGTFGIGAEYFFDENFSIGGEFGAQLLKAKMEMEWKSGVYNGSTNEDMDFTRTLNVSIIPIYSKISLNFYF